ncbi:MAG: fatty acid desaturase [Paludibacterium sp.]|uniref:DesA family fatty acid desaturase n=1 Tax=Paludibacterium sp. TaxID=1917523 RepID=UPI0025CBF5E9|nr:fatty acid desaturase [Paludibacterium sp.]MBV8048030.1 fatty acid desaturase [Paludibacterium sp.]
MAVFFHGLTDLPWWGYVLAALALTHVTIASVTIFLHRHQAHRALDLHPLISHFFRFWLWLTTGMVTKEWAAVHRKHHARCESCDDPHSPQVRGIWTVLFKGTWLYRDACANRDDIEKFGHATPDDWIERKLYAAHNGKGILLMLAIDLVLFGLPGLLIWGVQMIWIPLFAAGVINGVGHYWGYRNFECDDASTNIVPWGILIGGEELHNNHHTFGASAKLSYKWFEFDIGWMYIRILSMLGLARVRKVAPKLQCAGATLNIDAERLQAIVANRYALAARFARDLAHACQDELARVRGALPEVHAPDLPAKFKRWLKQESQQTSAAERVELEQLLANSPLVAKVYAMRQELSRVWLRSNLTREQLLQELHDWCVRAESSGIAALERFAIDLRRVAVA